MEEQIAVVGIDIGGTKIAAALFDAEGQLIQKEIQALHGRTGNEVAELAVDLANLMIHAAADRSYSVKAVGACVPGIYHPSQRTVWAPNIPGWEAYPLYDALAKGLKNANVSITIESDRSCYILGEVWKGNAHGCDHAIFIAVGTGIGAGIMSNGHIINGASGIAGAVGWLALDPPYEQKYDVCGNFEYYASGHGIARSAVELLKTKPNSDSLLAQIPLEAITAQDVFAAYEKKDPVAIKVIEKAILYWGMVVANLVSIFNPEKVIFGGGVFGPATTLLDRILQETKKWAQPISIREVSLEVSALQGDAGLIGAGYLALTSLDKSNEHRSDL